MHAARSTDKGYNVGKIRMLGTFTAIGSQYVLTAFTLTLLIHACIFY